MSDSTTWIALSSLIIAVLTFVVTQFTSRRAASLSYVDQLEADVEGLHKEIARLTNRVADLEDENLRLMKRLLANGGR